MTKKWKLLTAEEAQSGRAYSFPEGHGEFLTRGRGAFSDFVFFRNEKIRKIYGIMRYSLVRENENYKDESNGTYEGSVGDIR